MKFLQSLRTNLLQIFGILLSSSLFFIPLFYSEDWGKSFPLWAKMVLICAFIIYIIVQILEIQKNKNQEEMKHEIDNWRKEANLLLESHTLGLSKKLGFGNDTNGYINRISIYMKNSNGFYCVDRYSDSEEYRKKNKILYMNESKGILSVVWNEGNRDDKGYHDGGIPNPKTNLKIYKKYHKETYHLEDSDIKNLHMQSLLYYGWRIDSKNKPLGMILFETTKKDKFTQEQLNEIFKNEMPSVTHALKFILPNLPSPLYDSNKTI